MHLVVVSLLNKFKACTVEGVNLDAVDVGPVVVESHLLDNYDAVAESHALVGFRLRSRTLRRGTSSVLRPIQECELVGYRMSAGCCRTDLC